MTSGESRPESDDDGATMRFLASAGPRAAWPPQVLMDRLRRPDGQRWLEEQIGAAFGVQGSAAIRAAVIDNAPPLERLQELRRHAAGAGGMPADQAVSAALLYFVALAIGLAHHGVLISTKRPEVVGEALADLAHATPAPWSGLFLKAAEETGA